MQESRLHRQDDVKLQIRWSRLAGLRRRYAPKVAIKAVAHKLASACDQVMRDQAPFDVQRLTCTGRLPAEGNGGGEPHTALADNPQS